MPVPRRAARMLRALLVASTVLIASACGTSGSAQVEAPGSDRSLVHPDELCDEALESDDTVLVTAAHVVTDGRLGALCFGEPDDTLVEAWDELVAITPPGQLSDLAVVVGFVADEDDDSQTLAFVNALDSEGLAFQMSINLPAFDADRDEASLTLAHEFTHVFTQTPDQLDRSVADPAACETHFNGDGCYRPGSLMAAWIEEFWSDEELATVDVDADPYPEDGDDRCDVDDSFFGSYAATNPEEDFAEAFSAFVYRVAPLTAGQRTKLDWLAGQAGLAEFRSQALDAGLGPLENTFEVCGS
ncbi:hypothetical protein [Rhabdothermincola salaria]|uniref:hypothetical protein n=1 Tax=Rhabdothermincola salaria TaxID=2903142 RepID=UPI001E651AFF|nr:hypothetical protein [Rhabdothermincola salaria]MCD9623429.1 hypothetical protein [Rhabdothermincola salaria]